MPGHRGTSKPFVTMLLVSLAITSCGGGGGQPLSPVPVTGVSLNQKDWSTGRIVDCWTVVHQLVECWHLVATVSPPAATNQTVTWTSSDPFATLTSDPLGPLYPPPPLTGNEAWVLVPPHGFEGRALTVTATTEDGGFTATCDGTIPGP